MITEKKSENRRWTAKPKSALVLDIFKGKTTVSEASQRYEQKSCNPSWTRRRND